MLCVSTGFSPSTRRTIQTPSGPGPQNRIVYGPTGSSARSRPRHVPTSCTPITGLLPIRRMVRQAALGRPGRPSTWMLLRSTRRRHGGGARPASVGNHRERPALRGQWHSRSRSGACSGPTGAPTVPADHRRPARGWVAGQPEHRHDSDARPGLGHPAEAPQAWHHPSRKRRWCAPNLVKRDFGLPLLPWAHRLTPTAPASVITSGLHCRLPS